jgi:SAM-dependent methyltransferase
MSWSLDRISDESFRAKFLTVPQIVNDWVAEHRSLEGAEVLDFGCGEGIAALGLALNHGARRVVGVDIMPDPERCIGVAQAQIGLQALPLNLQLHRVRPGFLHDSNDRFDVIYSWSVFEHVDQRLIGKTLGLIKGALKPGGLFLAQIAPLYHSAEGGHLFHRIPEPWGHLLNQDDVYFEKLAATVPDSAELEALWSTYRTLNKITAVGLVESVRNAGFEILKRYVTQDAHEPSNALKVIYHEDVLRTNQIVLLMRVTEGIPDPNGSLLPSEFDRE